MSSSQKSPNSQTPPLSRWKGRLRIFNKLTFWASTSVLLLIGLLIADYSRSQMSQADIEDQLELASEDGKNSDGKGDRNDASELSKYSDAFQPETLDGIPLPDDPELREWAIREANDLNPESESLSQNDRANVDPEQPHSSEDALNDSLTDAPTRLLTSSEDAEEPSNNNSSDSRPRRNRQNRQQNRVESIFSDDIKADDVLALMGLKPPRASASNLSTRSLESTPSLESTSSSGENSLEFFSGSAPETFPPSALSQALQNLALESETQTATPSFPNETDSSDRFYQGANLDTSLVPIQGSEPSLEGVPIFQQPTIQTSPLPGTTGYIAPPPLPGATLRANDSIPPATVDTLTNAPVGSVAPSAALAPQPTVSVPQSQPTPDLPSPAFVAPAPVEHIPYTGGGRNGNINTFSNP